MAPAIHAIFGTQRVALSASAQGSTPVKVPAAYLTFEVEGDELPAAVILDKRTIALALATDGKRGYFQLDAFRSVGFHCIQIADARFYFATEDAKLKLEGILRLLEEVGRSGLSWGYQIFFADGTALRDPRVDYAWLLENGPRIVRATREIAAAPIRRARYDIKEEAPTGARVLVAPTLALLRRRGSRGVEKDDRGLLTFRSQRYSPRVAVVARRVRSFDTVANRRATSLLQDTISLASNVLRSNLPPDAKRSLSPITSELRDCLQLYPFALLLSAKRLPEDPSSEEMVDPRYALTFAMHDVLRRELGWHAGTEFGDHYAFVAFADQIYQAFVAALIARAVGAKPIGPTLHSGLDGPSFRSDRYDIYYDTAPPTPQFQSWRNQSGRPSDMRPDLTIIDRIDRLGLLIDAKYRIDGSRAPTTALNECQVYMHSFGQNAIAVCYPGAGPRVEDVTGGAFHILEVSLSPFNGVENYVTTKVWPKLQTLMQTLRT